MNGRNICSQTQKSPLISQWACLMAEREGFEPSMGFKAHTPLAGERLRPLGHLSRSFINNKDGARGRSRTSDRLVRSQVLYPAELHAQISFFLPVFSKLVPSQNQLET